MDTEIAKNNQVFFLTILSSELQIQLEEKGKTCPIQRRHLAGFWLSCMSIGKKKKHTTKTSSESFSGGKMRTRPRKTVSRIALMNCPEEVSDLSEGGACIELIFWQKLAASHKEQVFMFVILVLC